MAFEHFSPEFPKALERGEPTGVDGLPGEQQREIGDRPIAPIQSVVPPEELVVLNDHIPRRRVGKPSVEPHRGTAVGRQFRDRGADTRALVFPQRERLVVESAADEAGLQRRVAEKTLREIGEVRAVARAVPEIILVPSP